MKNNGYGFAYFRWRCMKWRNLELDETARVHQFWWRFDDYIEFRDLQRSKP